MAVVGRAGRVPAGHVVLPGTNEPSFDSRQFGPVPRTAVLGRVLAVLPLGCSSDAVPTVAG